MLAVNAALERSLQISLRVETFKALHQKELGSELIREACQQAYSYVDKIEVLSELLQTGLVPHGPSAEGRTTLTYAAGAGNVAW